MLTEAQKATLIGLAAAAVRARVGGTAPVTQRLDVELPAASGVFVTLKAMGHLRGCLGTLQPTHDLAREVARCAADSASADPRFAPVSDAELPQLSIEVSVLGPLEPVNPAEPGAIAIGRHGLVAEQGGRRGLLLPQVATEWNWTVEEFLRQTCAKAGLPGDAWRHGARVFRFEAEVFGA